ncbi:PLP-dependent aminotransferase family protein [Endozoicomonas gorgoniicola]|uniref:PLP-dependent aminotransferase family protein n=1 Tax=Endozoicomonas gorgoniicola TaxID=1234144 RepID=A0ABT3N389_9GAMM|nr:PLP-dependent aminotransferase family protein [Endozoicomonas gorgoniicola]MCW7556097.1 PLP-dependent aminotransferase family protein [Endozoicomonas gorgoniicola]
MNQAEQPLIENRHSDKLNNRPGSGWQPSLSRFSGPKYKALADAIEVAITEGRLNNGERLPTHRALADQLGVTIGTITRGYAEAERRRLVVARVGSGTFVLGKTWENRDFSIPVSKKAEDDVIDLTLSLTVPARKEQVLAKTLLTLAQNGSSLSELLDYHPETGLPRHRQAIVRWLRYHGMEADAENILITSGGQHATVMTLQGLLHHNDTVASDELTYPGFINATRQLQLKHLGLPMDDDGLIPSGLEACCQQHRPRLLYLMPSLQNPTASVMPLKRRQEIIAISKRYNLLIIEDDVQFISPENRLPSLYSLAPEQVIYVSSFAKHLAGGLRVGFIVSPVDLHHKIAMALRSNCWITPPLMAEVAREWIDSGEAWQLIAWQREEISQRRQLLQEILSDFDVVSQPHSFHGWLKLPAPWRAETFVRHMDDKGVKLLPSELFAVGSTAAPQAVRLCISTPDSREKLRTALERIKDALSYESIDIIRPMVF